MDDNLPTNIAIPVKSTSPEIRIPDRYGPYSDPERDIHFRDYLDILRKRKYLILGFFFGMVIVSAVISVLMTPIYRATTILQITQDNPAALMGERDPFSALYASETQGRFYETQYMLLNSLPMAYKIIDTLNLLDHPEFKAVREAKPDETPQVLKNKVANMVLAGLEIKPLKKSYLVEVAYESPDKSLTQQIVNVIADEYTQFSMETRRKSYELIRKWLDGELHSLATKVEDSEKKVYAHSQQKDFLTLEDKENPTISKYVDLSMLLTKAESERMAKEAQFQETKKKGEDASFITGNPLVQQLRKDIIAQEAKVASLSKIFGENYPQLQAEQGNLKELNSRLNNEIKRIRASVEADYNTTKQAEKLVREALETHKGKVGELQNNLVKYHILKRDMQTNEQLYQALLARMKETSVASTMVASNLAVISPAELPFEPFKPKKRLNVLIAALVGLVGGVGLAFLVEFFDDSLKTAEEVERVCHLPILGVVPLLTSKGKELTGKRQLDLITLTHPKSMIAEAIRQARTSLMLSALGGAPGVLVFTSPNPSEGKTTLAINLAISMALNDRKVVLIDTDMRKPGVHSIFHLSPVPGLSNYLTGTASVSEIMRPSEIPNLMVIPAGAVPPSPTEILSSRTFEDLLLKLREDFDHLIIDTPPIVEFADGRIVSTMAGGTVLVFRNHFTTRKAANLARKLLSEVNSKVLGVIFNMATANRLGYGGYYYGYYKYYSKYYEGYNNISQE
jgi:polysaccharide biosynthesis transport protein